MFMRFIKERDNRHRTAVGRVCEREESKSGGCHKFTMDRLLYDATDTPHNISTVPRRILQYDFLINVLHAK